MSLSAGDVFFFSAIATLLLFAFFVTWSVFQSQTASSALCELVAPEAALKEQQLTERFPVVSLKNLDFSNEAVVAVISDPDFKVKSKEKINLNVLPDIQKIEASLVDLEKKYQKLCLKNDQIRLVAFDHKQKVSQLGTDLEDSFRFSKIEKLTFQAWELGKDVQKINQIISSDLQNLKTNLTVILNEGGRIPDPDWVGVEARN